MKEYTLRRKLGCLQKAVDGVEADGVEADEGLRYCVSVSTACNFLLFPKITRSSVSIDGDRYRRRRGLPSTIAPSHVKRNHHIPKVYYLCFCISLSRRLLP